MAITVVSELLAPAGGGPPSFLATSGLGNFLVFVAGGYVARSGFLLPALVLNTAIWSATVVVAWQLAASVQGLGFMEVVNNNLGGLALYTIASAAGAAVGMWLYAIRSSAWLLDH